MAFFVSTSLTKASFLRSRKQKKPSKMLGFNYFGGEIGIRTPGTSRFNSFQDCRNRPLCHFSLVQK